MQKIGASEKGFLVEGIEQNIRSDGRTRLEFRPNVLETGILTLSNGSARLSLRDSSTDILASVKAEIGEPEPEHPTMGKIDVHVSCSPSVSAKFDGRVAEEINTELTLMLQRLLCTKSSLNLEELCIIKGKKVWKLHVDVRIFDSGGNLPDAIALAVYSAMTDVVLPCVRVVEGDVMSFEVDPDPANGVRLNTTTFPLCVTVYKVGTSLIVDATLEEALCAETQITVAVDSTGRVGGIQKQASGSIPVQMMQQIIDVARTSAPALFVEVQKVLTHADSTAERIGFL